MTYNHPRIFLLDEITRFEKCGKTTTYLPLYFCRKWSCAVNKSHFVPEKMEESTDMKFYSHKVNFRGVAKLSSSFSAWSSSFFSRKLPEINFFLLSRICKRNFANRLKTYKVIKDLAIRVSLFEKYFNRVCETSL